MQILHRAAHPLWMYRNTMRGALSLMSTRCHQQPPLPPSHCCDTRSHGASAQGTNTLCNCSYQDVTVSQWLLSRVCSALSEELVAPQQTRGENKTKILFHPLIPLRPLWVMSVTLSTDWLFSLLFHLPTNACFLLLFQSEQDFIWAGKTCSTKLTDRNTREIYISIPPTPTWACVDGTTEQQCNTQ